MYINIYTNRITALSTTNTRTHKQSCGCYPINFQVSRLASVFVTRPGLLGLFLTFFAVLSVDDSPSFYPMTFTLLSNYKYVFFHTKHHCPISFYLLLFRAIYFFLVT